MPNQQVRDMLAAGPTTAQMMQANTDAVRQAQAHGAASVATLRAAQTPDQFVDALGEAVRCGTRLWGSALIDVWQDWDQTGTFGGQTHDVVRIAARWEVTRKETLLVIEDIARTKAKCAVSAFTVTSPDGHQKRQESVWVSDAGETYMRGSGTLHDSEFGYEFLCGNHRTSRPSRYQIRKRVRRGETLTKDAGELLLAVPTGMSPRVINPRDSGYPTLGTGIMLRRETDFAPLAAAMFVLAGGDARDLTPYLPGSTIRGNRYPRRSNTSSHE